MISPIYFVKDQPVLLQKRNASGVPAGNPLGRIAMGLGWDAVKRSGWKSFLRCNIDLDASCILLDDYGNEVDAVWFDKLHSNNSAIVHTGDSLTGRGDGDNEMIMVALNKIPSNVFALAFVVGSYSGQSFGSVQNASCRVYDMDGDRTVFGEYSLTNLPGDHRGIVMAAVIRNKQNNCWIVRMIGVTTPNGRTYRDILPVAKATLICNL